MTSLVCWIGVDHRKTASLYVASDSRLTDSETGAVIADDAQKVFASSKHADVFGYCGNASGPPAALASLVRKLDCGDLIPSDDDEFARATMICGHLGAELVPAKFRGTFIVHGTRVGSGFERARFSAFRHYVNGRDEWDWSQLTLPDDSDVVMAEGSGAADVLKWRQRWQSAQGGRNTSRGVFSALCAVLERADDPRSGGAPQLVGIYQKGAARHFGVLFNGGRFVAGRAVDAQDALAWRDELFQLVDPVAKQPKRRAAKHKRPRGL